MRRQATKNEKMRTATVRVTQDKTEPVQKSYIVNAVVTKVPQQSRTIDVVVTKADSKPATQLVHVVDSVDPPRPPASRPVRIVEEPLHACKRVVDLGDDAEDG